MAVLSEMTPHRVRSFIRAFISPHAVWNLCSPAAFWLRKQQQQQSPSVGASQTLEVDVQERSRRARRLLAQAALWAWPRGM